MNNFSINGQSVEQSSKFPALAHRKGSKQGLVSHTSSRKPQQRPAPAEELTNSLQVMNIRSSNNKVVRSASSKSDATPEQHDVKPQKMTRAKFWTPEIENLHRFQLAGFRDSVEYASMFPSPEVWPESGFVRQLQNKKTGFHMYFRAYRECDDKYIPRIKIYEY